MSHAGLQDTFCVSSLTNKALSKQDYTAKPRHRRVRSIRRCVHGETSRAALRELAHKQSNVEAGIYGEAATSTGAQHPEMRAWRNIKSCFV